MGGGRTSQSGQAADARKDANDIMKFMLIMPPFRGDDLYNFPPGICYISAAMKLIDGVQTINLNLTPPFTNDLFELRAKNLTLP